MKLTVLLESILTVAAAGTACFYAIRYALYARMYGQVQPAFAALQVAALREPFSTVPAVGIPTPPEPNEYQNRFVRTGEFEFAYIIHRSADGEYIHHVVGRSDSTGPLSEAMLLCMRRLVQQFGPAGLEHEVMLHVEVAHATETQHIDFSLKPDQHAALLRAIADGATAD